MKVLAVTGYKPMEINIFKHDDQRISFIKYALKKRLISFLEEGTEWIIIAGQMGVELWTAEVVLELRESYDVYLGIIPPFENQDKRWPEPYQLLYQELIIQADFYKPLYKGSYKGPFQFQALNKWIVEKTDGSLFLMNEENPGSNYYLYEEAEKKDNYPFFFLTPADLEEAVEEWQMTDPRYWE